MATNTGIIRTYAQSVTKKRVITDMIDLMDPMDVPLLKRLGYGRENVSKFRLVNTPGTTYEWLEDAYSARNTTAAANVTQLTNDTTHTSIAVTTGDGAKFQKGDVLMADSELIWVSSISTDTLTGVRAFGGTTAATHASNVTLYLRTRARLEGADADDSTSTNPTSQSNVSQIFQKTIQVSETQQVVKQYGVDNEYNYQVAKAMEELPVLLNNAAYYGGRAAGSSSAARSMGGLGTFITTNVTSLSSSPALTQKNIEDAIEDCWDFGGKPNLLVAGAWAQKKIRDFYAPHVRTERDDTRGGIMIDRVLVTPVGWVDVLCDRNCPSTKLYILEENRIGWIPIREFYDEELAKTGDSKKGEVIGEYGFVVKQEKAHAIISGFSTSS